MNRKPSKTLDEFLNETDDNPTPEQDDFVEATVARIRSEISEGEYANGEADAPGKKRPKPQQPNQKPLAGKDPVKGVTGVDNQYKVSLNGPKTKVILKPHLSNLDPSQTRIVETVMRGFRKRKVHASEAAELQPGVGTGYQITMNGAQSWNNDDKPSNKIKKALKKKIPPIKKNSGSSPPIEGFATEGLGDAVASFVNGFVQKLTGAKVPVHKGVSKAKVNTPKINTPKINKPKIPPNPFGRAKHQDPTGPKVQQTQSLKPPPKPKQFAKSVASVWGNYPKNKPRPPGPENYDFDDSPDIEPTKTKPATSKVQAGSNKATDSSIASGHINSGEYKKLLKNKTPMRIGNQKISNEEAPTNAMGSSSSIARTGNIDTYDPKLGGKKKKPLKRLSFKDFVKGGRNSKPRYQ